jgi:hypothetical protein
MLKLFFTLLSDPLGLPIEPLWEYVILLIVGEISHEIAWSASPGGTFGSLIYWATKLLAFVVIWAVLYALIVAIQFIIAHWIWFAVGAVVLVAIGIALVIRNLNG